MVRKRWSESVPSGENGVDNLQHLLGLLSNVPAVVDSNNYLVVIDIGGNVGQTTSRLMREIVRNRADFVMFTYEPMKAYDSIVTRAQEENWITGSAFVVFQCAVGIRPGSVVFYYDSDTSEQSSQDSKAAGTSKFKKNVSIITMDQFFYDDILETIVRSGTPSAVEETRKKSGDAKTYQHHNIFFFKIDTEGYDMDVLVGSHRLLESRRARFIEFEYNDKWFSLGRNRTLREVSTQLYDVYGYECYFISEKYLHPIFGRWWRQDMEIRAWSNVFCGIKNDLYLRWIVRRFDHHDFSPLVCLVSFRYHFVLLSLSLSLSCHFLEPRRSD